MNLITLKEARDKNLAHYFTGKPCKYGHVGKRFTVCRSCFDCKYEQGLKRKLENPEAQRKYDRDYKRNTYGRDREKLLIRHKAWRESNSELYKKLNNENSKNHFLNNKSYYTSKRALRRARIKQRTPGWSEVEEIKAIYKLSAEISERTKIIHHVDHIVPLQGELVSGLHVLANLQIIPWYENLKKHNKFNIEEYNATFSQ